MYRVGLHTAEVAPERTKKSRRSCNDYKHVRVHAIVQSSYSLHTTDTHTTHKPMRAFTIIGHLIMTLFTDIELIIPVSRNLTILSSCQTT